VLLPPQVVQVTQAFLTVIDEKAPGLVQGLYLRGSLGFGEYFPWCSDVDFVAVLPDRPDDVQLEALAAAHAEVYDARPLPHFDGFHLLAADLAQSPADCRDVPCMFEGTFRAAGRFDVNPVSWHELAWHGITVRGPALSKDDLWTDDAVLRAFSYDNLSSYWARIADALAAEPDEAARPEAAAWCVLGVSRLHHLLATGSMTSKSGAGRHALTVFDAQWHAIISEALRAREQPDAPSAFESDAAQRGRDTIAFTAMAIEASLACGP
jgi:Domain of unknown function (DUF4111)